MLLGAVFGRSVRSVDLICDDKLSRASSISSGSLRIHSLNLMNVRQYVSHSVIVFSDTEKYHEIQRILKREMPFGNESVVSQWLYRVHMTMQYGEWLESIIMLPRIKV